MKTQKKVTKRYDKRQQDYQATIKKLNPKQAAGYRRPGSKNPKKVRG